MAGPLNESIPMTKAKDRFVQAAAKRGLIRINNDKTYTSTFTGETFNSIEAVVTALRSDPTIRIRAIAPHWENGKVVLGDVPMIGDQRATGLEALARRYAEANPDAETAMEVISYKNTPAAAEQVIGSTKGKTAFPWLGDRGEQINVLRMRRTVGGRTVYDDPYEFMSKVLGYSYSAPGLGESADLRSIPDFGKFSKRMRSYMADSDLMMVGSNLDLKIGTFDPGRIPQQVYEGAHFASSGFFERMAANAEKQAAEYTAKGMTLQAKSQMAKATRIREGIRHQGFMMYGNVADTRGNLVKGMMVLNDEATRGVDIMTSNLGTSQGLVNVGGETGMGHIRLLFNEPSPVRISSQAVAAHPELFDEDLIARINDADMQRMMKAFESGDIRSVSNALLEKEEKIALLSHDEDLMASAKRLRSSHDEMIADTGVGLTPDQYRPAARTFFDEYIAHIKRRGLIAPNAMRAHVITNAQSSLRNGTVGKGQLAYDPINEAWVVNYQDAPRFLSIQGGGDLDDTIESYLFFDSEKRSLRAAVMRHPTTTAELSLMDIKPTDPGVQAIIGQFDKRLAKQIERLQKKANRLRIRGKTGVAEQVEDEILNLVQAGIPNKDLDAAFPQRATATQKTATVTDVWPTGEPILYEDQNDLNTMLTRDSEGNLVTKDGRRVTGGEARIDRIYNQPFQYEDEVKAVGQKIGNVQEEIGKVFSGEMTRGGFGSISNQNEIKNQVLNVLGPRREELERLLGGEKVSKLLGRANLETLVDAEAMNKIIKIVKAGGDVTGSLQELNQKWGTEFIGLLDQLHTIATADPEHQDLSLMKVLDRALFEGTDFGKARGAGFGEVLKELKKQNKFLNFEFEDFFMDENDPRAVYSRQQKLLGNMVENLNVFADDQVGTSWFPKELVGDSGSVARGRNDAERIYGVYKESLRANFDVARGEADVGTNVLSDGDLYRRIGQKIDPMTEAWTNVVSDVMDAANNFDDLNQQSDMMSAMLDMAFRQLNESGGENTEILKLLTTGAANEDRSFRAIMRGLYGRAMSGKVNKLREAGEEISPALEEAWQNAATETADHLGGRLPPVASEAAKTAKSLLDAGEDEVIEGPTPKFVRKGWGFINEIWNANKLGKAGILGVGALIGMGAIHAVTHKDPTPEQNNGPEFLPGGNPYDSMAAQPSFNYQMPVKNSFDTYGSRYTITTRGGSESQNDSFANDVGAIAPVQQQQYHYKPGLSMKKTVLAPILDKIL